MSLIIYLLGIAVGSTLYFYFARSVSMKLIELKNGVLRVGLGQLDTNVPVTTKDEIGIVAEAFNKMTVDLKAVTVSKKLCSSKLSPSGRFLFRELKASPSSCRTRSASLVMRGIP